MIKKSESIHKFEKCSLLKVKVQFNLDLVTLNLVTTRDLVTIFQRAFINMCPVSTVISLYIFAV